jgi:hypothetical protein
MGIITRQVGSNAKGSSLTYAEMDNNLIYLDGKVTGSSGYMAVFSGSNAISKSLIYQTGSQIGINTVTFINSATLTTLDLTINALESPNTFVINNGPGGTIPFRVSTDGDYVYINADTDITGSLIVTSNISSSTANIATLTTNILSAGTASISNTLTAATASISNTLTVTGSIINDGLVSCSIAISGNSGARSFTVSLTKNNGTALTNQRQVVHWWTSGTQYGAASAIASNSYAIVSGSNIVPISNSGSINHAVTDTSGKFAVKLSNDTSSPLANPVYFHITVQGAVFVANSTVDTNSSPPV